MHVGIIMDGNRTWAKFFGLPFIDGHKKGVEALKNIIEACPSLGIKTLTVYAFSTENFNRPADQVDGILKVIAHSASFFKEKLRKSGVCVNIIGNLLETPNFVQQSLNSLVDYTKNETQLILQIAVNYGGRDEIVRAVNGLIQENIPITEQTLSQHLDSSAESDIIIRTGGHMRTSNFLPWQGVYSELFFVKKNWPDFTAEDLKNILTEFEQRNRKFGK